MRVAYVMSDKPRITPTNPSKAEIPRSGDISLDEIQDVLQDDGYSANQRKAWLKEVLTDLQDDR